MPDQRICAVVVTYNRLDLLRECLSALLAQTRPLDEVIVVDSQSTDGTREAIPAEFPQVELVVMEENLGCAAGVHDGLELAIRRGFDWAWLMDDDTIPDPDALEELMRARGNLDGLPEPAMLASKVVWTDGAMHPMNTPSYDMRDQDIVARGLEHGVLPLRWNTYPSLLVRTAAVERHGPPRRHWFIWGDDIDFSARILRHEAGYLVPKSVALHKTKTAHLPWQGGERFYYAVRNSIFMLRGPAFGAKERVGYFLLLAEQIRLFLTHERFGLKSLAVVLKGVRDGLLRSSR